MLLSISYDVIESLIIKLVFENESVKSLKVELGDYVSVTYNKDGKRRIIEGYVKRIYLDNRFEHYKENCHHNQHWCMIIDGSMTGDNNAGRVEVSKILDLDILKKQSESNYINTPMNNNRVTDFRLVGNTLQLSQDNGENWVNVVDLPVEKPSIEDCDCNLVSKIESFVPTDIRADLQKQLIENIAKLVQEEKECNCDCHKPTKPEKPSCNCGCNDREVIQPIYSSFTTLCN